MMLGPQLTFVSLRVLRLFLIDPRRERHVYEVATELGYTRSSIYSILTRFVTHGWAAERKEKFNRKNGAMPSRRLFKITARGEEHARAAFAQLGVMF